MRTVSRCRRSADHQLIVFRTVAARQSERGGDYAERRIKFVQVVFEIFFSRTEAPATSAGRGIPACSGGSPIHAENNEQAELLKSG